MDPPRKLATWAIENGMILTTEEYIELCNKEELNRVDEYGETLLHKAARMGNSQLIIKLVEKGADVTKPRLLRHAFGEDSTTALLLALGDNCHGDYEKTCLTSQAYAALCHPSIINRTGHRQLTPLHLAARNCNSNAIEELVKAGANPAGICNGGIPLNAFFGTHQDIFCNNSRAILPLIPQRDILLDPDDFVRYIKLCWRDQMVPTYNAEVFARMLPNTRSDDYFSQCEVVAHLFPCLSGHELEFTVHIRTMPFYEGLNIQQMLTLSLLVRKGFGARTSPQCSAALARHRATGKLYPKTSTVAESNEKYEEFAEKIREIEDLFAQPLSLSEQCAITISRNLRTPKHANAHQLPLPPLILEIVTFQSLAKQICDRAQNNS